MSDKHQHSFFGQSMGLFLSSSSITQPYIYLTCIKKKENGQWEKLTLGEGKRIKLNLKEIAMIKEVLQKERLQWRTFHSYRQKATIISVSWDYKDFQRLWINIDHYSKPFRNGEIETLKILLNHLFMEKIEYSAESYNHNNNNFYSQEISTTQYGSETYIPKKIQYKTPIKNQNNNRITKISGIIKAETEKAILLRTINGQESWIPKSTIRTPFSQNNKKVQELAVDTWVLKKNKLSL